MFLRLVKVVFQFQVIFSSRSSRTLVQLNRTAYNGRFEGARRINKPRIKTFRATECVVNIKKVFVQLIWDHDPEAVEIHVVGDYFKSCCACSSTSRDLHPR